MNDPESAVSPKRFWRRFGRRNATRKASAGTEFPKNRANAISRTRPSTLLASMAIPMTNAARPVRGSCCSFTASAGTAVSSNGVTLAANGRFVAPIGGDAPIVRRDKLCGMPRSLDEHRIEEAVTLASEEREKIQNPLLRLAGRVESAPRRRDFKRNVFRMSGERGDDSPLEPIDAVSEGDPRTLGHAWSDDRHTVDARRFRKASNGLVDRCT